MELQPFITRLQQELAAAAQPGGEAAEALAGRLVAPLHSAIRLLLLDVVSTAADEITRELAPGSVDVRLRGGDPELVVTAPPAVASAATGAIPASDAEPASVVAASDEDGSIARINLRLPDGLKRRVEQAADEEGVSINTWLVRAVAATVTRGDGSARREPAGARGGQSYSGWGR